LAEFESFSSAAKANRLVYEAHNCECAFYELFSTTLFLKLPKIYAAEPMKSIDVSHGACIVMENLRGRGGHQDWFKDGGYNDRQVNKIFYFYFKIKKIKRLPRLFNW
jgi:hypothetical protein